MFGNKPQQKTAEPTKKHETENATQLPFQLNVNREIDLARLRDNTNTNTNTIDSSHLVKLFIGWNRAVIVKN
jgi:hypothetical protein